MSISRFEVNRTTDPVRGITAEDVVLHADRQRQRGKNPSAWFMGNRNPRRALEIAHGHLESAKIKNPEDVLDIKEGSILAWVRAQDPERREEFTAVSALSESSPAVRAGFIGEMVTRYASLPDAVKEGESAASVVAGNMRYVTSDFNLGHRGAWAEAIDAVLSSAADRA
jgi:hypothetical protein